MDDEITKNTQISYDRLADEYVRRIYDELQDKPLDRQLLDEFAARRIARRSLGCFPAVEWRAGTEGGA
jgi:hypothetical protein